MNSGKLSIREFSGRCSGTYRHLCYVAAGIIGKTDGAEDIVQQAFAIAVEKDLRFESEAQLVAWLSGVVRHCALNYRRKLQRRKTQPTDPIVLSNVEENKSSELEHIEALHLSATQTSFDDNVINALMQLTPESRSCLLLRTVEQLSYKEISKLMNIPEGTALSMVHRSRKKLRQLLADKKLASAGSKANENPSARFTY